MTQRALADANTTASSSSSILGRAASSEVTCGKCDRRNSAESRFCSECGQSLWGKCPACGIECASSESYCQGCGVNQNEFVTERIAEIESALAAATELEAEHRLDHALRELRRVKLIDDPRIDPLAAEVKTRIDELADQNESQQAALTTGIERIRELIDAHKYDVALQLIDKLPPTLRSDETQRLQQTATDRLQEIEQLKTELTEAVKKKEILDLAPRFQRLITLKPDSKTAAQLATLVRNGLVRGAQKWLKAFEYAKASDLLRRIPACAFDEKVEKLRTQVTEIKCIYDDLRFSPIIDKPLVQIAKRIAKQVPGDKTIGSLCSKIARLATEAHDDERFPGVPWIRAPKRAYLNCDVEWLGGSKRLVVDDAHKKKWGAHRGCLFVAAGLALQGVGLAAINTNLRDEKASLFGKLSIRRREKTQVAWGIDVGDSALKAIRLVLEPGQSQPQIDRCEVIPYRCPLSRPDAQSSYGSLLGETIEKLHAQHTIEKSDRICVGLPGQRVLGRFFQLPNAPAKKLTGMIKYEASQQIPIPEIDLASAHHVLRSEDGDAEDESGASTRVLYLAMKRSLLDETLRAFDAASLEPCACQSECVALYNFARFEGLCDLLPKDATDECHVALLDVGTEGTNLVMVSEQAVWFRSLRIGGDNFTQAIVRNLKLTTDQAEKLKRQPAAARSIHRLYEVYDPIYTQMTAEIRRSMELFEKENGGKVTVLLGVGGGFLLHGLMRYLRSGPE